MHEIITLQLGQAANYVGTHFWNTQESYFTYGGDEASPIDHNVHWRAGVGVGGVDTFTPRALIYDLKGGFGSMRKVNALYDELEGGAPPAGSWDHGTKQIIEPPIAPSQFQKDLDAGLSPPAPLTTADVRYWSDFNRVYYHPRSSVQLSEYTLDSTLQPFERYEGGKELFRSLHREHDVLDRDFRRFAEECDQMQGVQVVTSADDGWAGFAAEYVQELRDEYGKVGIVTWGLEKADRVVREKQLARTVAVALTLSTLSQLSSLYIPLLHPPSQPVPGYVTIDRTSAWHTSALLAAGIETSLIPTRLHNPGQLGRLNDIAAHLNATGGQRIATLDMTVDGRAENNTDDDRPPRRDPKASKLHISWPRERAARGPSSTKQDHVYAHAAVARGFRESDEPDERGCDDRDPGHGGPIYSSCNTDLAFPHVPGFPSDILPTYSLPAPHNTDGDDNDDKGSPVSAITASLTTSTAILGRIQRVRDVAAWTVAVDEREALLDGLDAVVDGFLEGRWCSDGEEEDD